MMKPLIMDPLVKKARIVSPRTIKEKYSGGPNWMASLARGGDRKTRIKTPSVPAMKEPKAAMPRAGPARPFRAIW